MPGRRASDRVGAERARHGAGGRVPGRCAPRWNMWNGGVPGMMWFEFLGEVGAFLAGMAAILSVVGSYSKKTMHVLNKGLDEEIWERGSA